MLETLELCQPPGLAPMKTQKVEEEPTKSRLSNLVMQGKSAAAKLAKVLAGEITLNAADVEVLKSKAEIYKECAALPRSATSTRVEIPESWENDHTGRARRKVIEKETGSKSAKIVGTLSRADLGCLSRARQT